MKDRPCPLHAQPGAGRRIRYTLRGAALRPCCARGVFLSDNTAVPFCWLTRSLPALRRPPKADYVQTASTVCYVSGNHNGHGRVRESGNGEGVIALKRMRVKDKDTKCQDKRL
ncbi:hypothetical protein EVAR_26864_1 [Eumeta japonica]|uniref:Uncharacterized protein n=1 Tax=Eumeta variegata TaxID=151549 RepID=A0A4C1VVJ3_EUMVA|nr:hypothetical protein EVAR_26864_1 [Eumeta japonica]